MPRQGPTSRVIGAERYSRMLGGVLTEAIGHRTTLRVEYNRTPPFVALCGSKLTRGVAVADAPLISTNCSPKSPAVMASTAAHGVASSTKSADSLPLRGSIMTLVAMS